MTYESASGANVEAADASTAEHARAATAVPHTAAARIEVFIRLPPRPRTTGNFLSPNQGNGSIEYPSASRVASRPAHRKSYTRPAAARFPLQPPNGELRPGRLCRPPPGYVQRDGNTQTGGRSGTDEG